MLEGRLVDLATGEQCIRCRLAEHKLPLSSKLSHMPSSQKKLFQVGTTMKDDDESLKFGPVAQSQHRSGSLDCNSNWAKRTIKLTIYRFSVLYVFVLFYNSKVRVYQC